MFRASQNKTQVGFRLTQRQADALAVAAEGANNTPGGYAKQAVLEKVDGDPLRRTLAELQVFRNEVLTKMADQEKELQELRAELKAFRGEFIQALPES